MRWSLNRGKFSVYSYYEGFGLQIGVLSCGRVFGVARCLRKWPSLCVHQLWIKYGREILLRENEKCVTG